MRGRLIVNPSSGADRALARLPVLAARLGTLVRDLDMDMVRQMRDDWQFYRDRRPDSYTQIARP